MQRRIKRLQATLAALGFAQGLRYVALRRVFRPLRNALLTPRQYTLRSRYAAFPLRARSDSSDLEVFHQIFVALEYACLKNLKNVDLVIDCGANVGYSSAYFLTQFPACRVIAVEPDPQNFAMLQTNLAPYGDRAALHRAGIWSHPAELVIDDVPYRDGRQWTRQVRERRPGESGGLQAIDIGALLNQAHVPRISLLKMDIEGAEVVVFSDSRHRSWLDRVDAMAVELHDDTHFGKATEVFFPAIESQGFTIAKSGELTICIRPQGA
jgi:FkbM family methyltransferase